eukprot:Amastigsp_a818_4.p3 type:complete len:127 gc:universal Amastigsp_a818_4:444-824(+)
MGAESRPRRLNSVQWAVQLRSPSTTTTPASVSAGAPSAAASSDCNSQSAANPGPSTMPSQRTLSPKCPRPPTLTSIDGLSSRAFSTASTAAIAASSARCITERVKCILSVGIRSSSSALSAAVAAA